MLGESRKGVEWRVFWCSNYNRRAYVSLKSLPLTDTLLYIICIRVYIYLSLCIINYMLQELETLRILCNETLRFVCSQNNNNNAFVAAAEKVSKSSHTSGTNGGSGPVPIRRRPTPHPNAISTTLLQVHAAAAARSKNNSQQQQQQQLNNSVELSTTNSSSSSASSSTSSCSSTSSRGVGLGIIRSTDNSSTGSSSYISSNNGCSSNITNRRTPITRTRKTTVPVSCVPSKVTANLVNKTKGHINTNNINNNLRSTTAASQPVNAFYIHDQVSNIVHDKTSTINYNNNVVQLSSKHKENILPFSTKIDREQQATTHPSRNGHTTSGHCDPYKSSSSLKQVSSTHNVPVSRNDCVTPTSSSTVTAHSPQSSNAGDNVTYFKSTPYHSSGKSAAGGSQLHQYSDRYPHLHGGCSPLLSPILSSNKSEHEAGFLDDLPIELDECSNDGSVTSPSTTLPSGVTVLHHSTRSVSSVILSLCVPVCLSTPSIQTSLCV